MRGTGPRYIPRPTGIAKYVPKGARCALRANL